MLAIRNRCINRLTSLFIQLANSGNIINLELKPVEESPKHRRVGRKSEYDRILEKSLEDESTKYAEVSKKGVKNISSASALKNRIKKKKLDDSVNVRMISKKVCLEKIWSNKD